MRTHAGRGVGQAHARRARRRIRLFTLLGLVWTLCFLAAASNAEQTVSAAARSAQEKPQALAQEIADIEAQIDAILDAAIAGIPSLLPGSPQRVPALGKILFFDKELSVNRNEACAFCHMPQTGFQGAIESSIWAAWQCPARYERASASGSLQAQPMRHSHRRFTTLTNPGKENARNASSEAISGICVRRDCGCKARPPCRRTDHRSIRSRWQIPIQPVSCAGCRNVLIVHCSRAYGGHGHLPYRGRRMSIRSAASPTAIHLPSSAPRFLDRTICPWSSRSLRQIGREFNRPSIKWAS